MENQKKVFVTKMVDGKEITREVPSDPYQRLEDCYINEYGSLPFTPRAELEAYMQRLEERERYPLSTTNLWRRRHDCGIRKCDMPFLLGISYSGYQNIENGVSLPKLPLAFKIAKLLGTTVDELFGVD